MNPNPISSDPAFALMSLDLISQILSRMDKPAEAIRYLAFELRELTGARGVLLTQCGSAPDGSECRVLCLEPALVGNQAGSELSALIRAAHQSKTASVWPAAAGPDACAALAHLGFNLALVVPLQTGMSPVGSLVLLGLPNPERVDEVRELMQTLAGILALMLQNAYLYQTQEQIIAQRTQALRESEEKFRMLFDSAADGLCVHNAEGRIKDVNQTLCAELGYTREELLRLSIADIEMGLKPADLSGLWERTCSGQIVTMEGLHRRRDGSTFPAEIRITHFFSGGSSLFYAATRNTTERKQTEAVQAFLAQTGAGAAGGHFFNTLAGFLAENLQMDFVCIDRLEGDGLKARTLAVWHDGHFEDNVTYALKDTPCGDVVGKQVCCFPANVCQFFPRDQVLQDLRAESYAGVTLFDHVGKPIGLIAVISRKPLANRSLAEAVLKRVAARAAGELERLQAEDALRESSQFNRQVIESAHEGVIVYGADLRYQVWNPFMEELTGLKASQVLGKHPLEVFPFLKEAGLIERLEMALVGEIPGPIEFSFDLGWKTGWTLDTSTPFRNTNGEIIGVIATVQDITKRKREEEEREKLQAQLTQAQKMESVGRLAGGVAHDFNNMLTVIQGNAAMVLEDLPPDSPQRENLAEIEKCARRSADLTRQLLAFARKQTVSPKVLDLNETLESMLKMLRRLIGEDIDLAWHPATGLWPIKADPSQIDQILANLCVNARDAIGGVGKITLETENVKIDQAYCETHTDVEPGEYVALALSDDGCGMDKEVLAHLFEPFFTTKEVGKGTGLGLATVYGIVKQNHGFINVQSEPGRGTTFKVHVPRHAEKAAQIHKVGPAVPTARGHETILLVEDEPLILKIGGRVLESLGYTVLTAATPGEAVRLAREHAGEIHLLVTDVIMPEMNGRDLAKNLLSLYPGLKRLFMSGYTADVIAHHGVLEEGIHFLQKPFTKEVLASKVSEALAQ